MRFEGLQACTKFFQGGTPPPLLAYWLLSRIFHVMTPNSQKWHDSLNRKWMRPRNVGATRTTLTREDSEWSRKFEEPWQSRPRDWRGVGQVFLQDPL
jgi:hypothetical protein